MEELLEYLANNTLEMKKLYIDFKEGKITFTFCLWQAEELIDKSIKAVDTYDSRKQDERMAQETNQ